MSELSTPLCWSQQRFRYPRFRFHRDSNEIRQLLFLVWLPLQFQEQRRIRAPLRGMESWSFSWEFLLMGWWVHTLYWDHDSSWQSKPPQIDGCFNLVLNFASPIWFQIEEPGSLSRWWPASEPTFCCLHDFLCFNCFVALHSPSRLKCAQTTINWSRPEGASGLEPRNQSLLIVYQPAFTIRLLEWRIDTDKISWLWWVFSPLNNATWGHQPTSRLKQQPWLASLAPKTNWVPPVDSYRPAISLT